ncbi:15-hydroxyprostaglandin dehydrogenase [NAD+] [Gryllus bimaculatus]|nr:15-hydroxyprostaglandin dehydrogenase [NAD+] [Gryllus bimaculatus]
MQRFKAIDIVVNGAGVFDDLHWEREIDISLKGVIRGSLLAWKHLGKDEGGRGGVVLNIASVLGIDPLLVVVVGFSRSLRAGSGGAQRAARAARGDLGLHLGERGGAHLQSALSQPAPACGRFALNSPPDESFYYTTTLMAHRKCIAMAPQDIFLKEPIQV